jgi:hypothetical protein
LHCCCRERAGGQGLVALGSALGELASKVSNDLLRIG